MSIGQVCVREIDLADAEEPIHAAAARMRDRRVGTLFVVDAQQRPIGVLTDRDIAMRVVAESLPPSETTVGDVMSVAPTCVIEATTVEEALRIMREGPHRRLPVVNGRQELVGVVSLDDILGLLAEDFREIGWLLQREGPASLLASV